MAPVARPAMRTLRKVAIGVPPGPAWAPARGPTIDLLAELRQHSRDDLLALLDLGHEALPVDVAVLVVGHLHEDSRLLLRRDGHAVQSLGEFLGIDLADFLGRRLHDIDGQVALYAVVVGHVV